MSLEPAGNVKPPSLYELAYQAQTRIASPQWTASKEQPAIAISLGAVTGDRDDMIVSFSVLNRSEKWVEILAPQIELASLVTNGSSDEKKSKGKVLADRVAVKEFRLTTRKLAPGTRMDGADPIYASEFQTGSGTAATSVGHGGCSQSPAPDLFTVHRTRVTGQA